MADNFFNVGDGSDALANHGLVLEFHSIHVNKNVIFKAFVTDYQDQFDSRWNQEFVFGRNDPIATYQGTARKISLGWQTVSTSFEEAQRNLRNSGDLAKLLYPSYDATSAGSLASAPVFRVKFGNLITGNRSGRARTSGLYCFITGFNLKPNFDPGFYIDTAGASSISSDVHYYPKIIDLSCTLNIVHEHALGFDSNSRKFRDQTKKFSRFPYHTNTRLGLGTAAKEADEDSNEAAGSGAGQEVLHEGASAVLNAGGTMTSAAGRLSSHIMNTIVNTPNGVNPAANPDNPTRGGRRVPRGRR